MPSARINGIDFYYEVHGEGPAIVFAHGGAGNHLVWWQQVPAKAFLYHQMAALNREAPHKIPPIPAFPVEVLNQYRIPTLLVVGEEDAILNSASAMLKAMEVMAQHVLHARLVKFPKAGHSVYFEQSRSIQPYPGGVPAQLLRRAVKHHPV
ncbi:MAG: alpha/beta fold hydrolase [Candidatus Binataceae bacterium]